MQLRATLQVSCARAIMINDNRIIREKLRIKIMFLDIDFYSATKFEPLISFNAWPDATLWVRMREQVS